MSIEFLSKRLRRRGFRETDKGWTSAVGLVPIGPCIGVWSFRAYDCSFRVRRRRAWRTRGYRTKDTRGIGKRRYPIYRGEWWRTRCTPTKVAQAEAVRADGDAWEEAAAGVEFIDENGGGPGARLKKNPLAQQRRRSKKVAEP